MCSDECGIDALHHCVQDLKERVAALEAGRQEALTQHLYAWYMGEDADVLIVAAPSVPEAKKIGRAKIREIYPDALWQNMYRQLDAPCIRVDEGALFLDSCDIAFAEDDARIAAEGDRP